MHEAQLTSMSATISAPTSLIESIGGLRFPIETDRHLQKLMDRNTDGLLQPTERTGLAALAALSEEMALLRSQALQLLGKQPK
jgi:hypothetical protein